MRRALLLVGWIATGACDRPRDAGPACAIAAAQAVRGADAELGARHLDEATRARLRGELGAVRDGIARACVSDGWPAAVRACLAQAPGHAEAVVCERQLTDAQRASLERSLADRDAGALPTSP